MRIRFLNRFWNRVKVHYNRVQNRRFEIQLRIRFSNRFWNQVKVHYNRVQNRISCPCECAKPVRSFHVKRGMVLLGIHTAVKEDVHVHCTAAELVYGTTLHLPSQLFSASSSDIEPILHMYSASSLPCNSFMLHLSVLIIALFTFLTASPHVHMSLSDRMPSASRYNIPMMAHTRYLSAHPNTSP